MLQQWLLRMLDPARISAELLHKWLGAEQFQSSFIYSLLLFFYTALSHGPAKFFLFHPSSIKT